MNPLISVVIPSYNGAKYILKTVESVLQQTYQPIEILVVDDGSKDNTEEILKPVMSRIRFIKKGNGGPASARNAGIKAAQGEFIAFLDGDDVWASEKLERQMPFFSDVGVGLVYADTSIIDSDGNPVERTVDYSRHEGRVFEELFRKNFIPTSTVIVRKSCFDQSGYFDEDRELISVEDYDLWLRISFYFLVRRVPERLTLYRRHLGNISGNVERSYNGEKKVLKKVLTDFGSRFPKLHQMTQQRLGFLYFELGREYWDLFDLPKAKEFFKKSLSLRPFAVKPWFFYISAVLGPGWINFCRRMKKKK